MKCYECKWLDRSVVLTSNPPQYRCALGFGSHYADHECEYDFMPIVRCNECRCRGTDECPMYWEEWNVREDGDELLLHDYSRDDGFCDWGERREP